MSERLLPPVRLIKNKSHGRGVNAYDVLTVFDAMKLGEVRRASHEQVWTAYIAIDHPAYGAGVRVAGHTNTRSGAVDLLVQKWVASVDEITAHKVNDALINGVQDAEWRAEACRQEADDQPLTYEDGGTLDFSSWALRDSCDALEHDLKNILAGRASFFDATPEAIYELATKLHFMRLELTRRTRQSQYLLLPSGDYTEDEPAQKEINWRQRACELAELYGKALANTEGSYPWETYTDQQMLEFTVDAATSLARLKAKPGVCGPEDIMLRAKVYQRHLNESHRRALLFATKESR